ncbi:MAG TPA: FUSC family protein, partial [Agrobacterium sp.]|nr:FUSC family protein [Agrobacterium sp.]
TIGILVGEIALLVPHDVAEIGLASATFIAMILASMFGLPPVVPIQAGASAMLVLLMGPQAAGFVRFVDVIVGVATGVAVALVFFRERLKL